MGKFRFSAIAAGFALTAAFAAPSFAIGNAAECSSEGGSMVNVKGSDFCLVPMRDKAYAGPEYDGNQLGVVECPGSKLNDGAYCMHPVTLANRDANIEVLTTPEPVITTKIVPADEDAVMDVIVDEASDAAKEVVKEKAMDNMGSKASSAIE